MRTGTGGNGKRSAKDAFIIVIKEEELTFGSETPLGTIGDYLGLTFARTVISGLFVLIQGVAELTPRSVWYQSLGKRS
ncbi:hypothetical protein AV530_003310 [Patagioenas fasciata monilis]|uniref:Uncharacterized protein n=1 Tax=Patagioenas fasciata monilis TaxID=372326 RepID=A0A1V4K3N7_PATFA|nr:hypothetical protein AV530_003310 [Patagioenas fasciata monilis]